MENWNKLSNLVCDNLESLLTEHKVTLLTNGKYLVGCCPVHGGDNKTALNFYPDGYNMRGFWKCRSHQCQEHFKATAIGFIRGILSNRKYGWTKKGDKEVSFNDTVSYLSKYFELSRHLLSSKEPAETKFFDKLSDTFSPANKPEPQKKRLFRDDIRKFLEIPAEYYLKRGYSQEVLNNYDIGLCKNPNSKEMFNRIVVPIYDSKNEFQGCTGRSLYDKCGECSLYHEPAEACPTNYLHQYCKWRNQNGFHTEFVLYNLWKAEKFINESKTIVVVEGPGDVWRLVESGINNAVAVLGDKLTDPQQILIEKTLAQKVFVLTDNDDAGTKCSEKIYQKLKNLYSVHRLLPINRKDVGDMSIDEIKKEFSGVLL